MSKNSEQSQGKLRKQRKPFVMSPTHLFTNPEISSVAKSLWNVLDSKPDGWVFFWSEILKHFKEGRDAVKNSMKELEKFGYVQRKKARKGNLFCGMDIEVFYDPALPFDEENEPLIRVTENQSPDNQSSKNQATKSRQAEDQSANKKLSKQDLSKKYLSNSLSFPLANAKRENFSKPSLLEVKQIFIDKNLKSDSEKYFLFREKANWSGVKNLEADIAWWENGFKEKNPDLYAKKSTGHNLLLVEEESQEIKNLRSSIKSQICWQFPNSSKGSVIYSKLFLDARIEQNGNDYTIFAKDQQALEYGEVLAKINVIVEIESE